MLDISLISCQVDGKSKQLYSTNVGMREQDEFDYVVHAVGIGQSVADSCFSGKQVQNIECSHSIGTILCKQMYKFGDESSFLDMFTCNLIEAQIVVDHK